MANSARSGGGSTVGGAATASSTTATGPAAPAGASGVDSASARVPDSPRGLRRVPAQTTDEEKRKGGEQSYSSQRATDRYAREHEEREDAPSGADSEAYIERGRSRFERLPAQTTPEQKARGHLRGRDSDDDTQSASRKSKQ